MSISSRHHFIPKFYLENFTNEDNHFFVFDKKNPDKILKKSPKQVCYETNRNSFFGKDNIPIPFLEDKTYKYFDSLHATIIKNLSNNIVDNDFWSKNNVQVLEFFIPFLFWRNPRNDKLFEDFINRLSRVEDLGLTMFDNKTKTTIDDLNFHKEVLSNSDFKKGARINASIETFNSKIKKFKELEWRVYDYEGFGGFLTSDYPLLFKFPFNELADLRGDVIFPISPKRSFLRIDENKQNTFPIPVIQNFHVIKNAERFVISKDKEYLQLIISEYSKFCRNGNIDEYLKTLWEF